MISQPSIDYFSISTLDPLDLIYPRRPPGMRLDPCSKFFSLFDISAMVYFFIILFSFFFFINEYLFLIWCLAYSFVWLGTFNHELFLSCCNVKRSWGFLSNIFWKILRSSGGIVSPLFFYHSFSSFILDFWSFLTTFSTSAG